jgi:hypothetical protein
LSESWTVQLYLYVRISKAVASSVMLQLYFDMIFITAFKIKYKLYSLSVSPPPTSKVKNSGCSLVIEHVGTDDSDQDTASVFRVDVSKCERVVS